MLKYRNLNAERDWWFFDSRKPVPETVRAAIHPLTDEAAEDLWSTIVSRNPKEIKSKDLPRNHWICSVRSIGPDWYLPWNDSSKPDDVITFLASEMPWQMDESIIFILSKKYMVSTTWGLFVTNWKNFLFSDDGPIIISLSHPEFIFFANRGFLAIGCRFIPSP